MSTAHRRLTLGRGHQDWFVAPDASWAGRVAGGHLRQVVVATAPPGRDVEGRCVEGPRGGPGVGERGVVGRSWFRRSWPAADRGDGRLSREPAERAGVAPGLPAPGLCPGGPDDRSATGRRGWGTGLLSGLAGGVSSQLAAAQPGPPAGQRPQHVASAPRSEPVGAFGPV
jgi:hypothetical protein